MFEDFSRCVEWVGTESIEIHAIFKTYGDETYDNVPRIAAEKKCFFIYTFDGQGELTIQGRSHALYPNSLIIVNSQNRMRYRCMGDKWNLWLVVFQMDVHLLAWHEVIAMALDSNDLMELSLALNALKRSNAPLAAAYFAAVYYSAYDKYKRQGLSKHQLILEDALDYMRNHIADFTVNDLCQELLVSERTLRMIFQNELHSSPKKHFQYLRMEEAKMLLERGLWSIERIALTLGFSSPGHFSSCFKKLYGITPFAYREAFKY